jgi:hypothetical protein
MYMETSVVPSDLRNPLAPGALQRDRHGALVETGDQQPVTDHQGRHDVLCRASRRARSRGPGPPPADAGSSVDLDHELLLAGQGSEDR